ncbi:MAG: hypothetical protein ACP5RW_01880 [bacterium]
MSKVLLLIGGLVCVILGLWGIIAWWSYFMKALMALVPPGLIIIGVLLAIFGYSDIKSSLEEKRNYKG